VSNSKYIGSNARRLGKRTRREITKPEQWYRLTAFFDQTAKKVIKVGEEDVLLCGHLPPDNECAVVTVPPSVTQDQGLALQKIIEGSLRKPVLILTNNTQLMRLKPITDARAKKIMGGQEKAGEIVQIEKAKG